MSKKPSPPATPAPVESDLPADLPGRDALIAAGVTTVEMLREIDDVQSVPGIGQTTAARIHAHLPPPGSSPGSAPATGSAAVKTSGGAPQPPDPNADQDKIAMPPPNTEPVKAAAAPAKKPDANTLPKDFPCRQQLLDAGYTSVDAVKRIGDLTSVPGVRAPDIHAIRTACGWEGTRRPS